MIIVLRIERIIINELEGMFGVIQFKIIFFIGIFIRKSFIKNERFIKDINVIIYFLIFLYELENKKNMVKGKMIKYLSLIGILKSILMVIVLFRIFVIVVEIVVSMVDESIIVVRNLLRQIEVVLVKQRFVVMLRWVVLC